MYIWRSLSWLGTGTSIKRGRLTLVYPAIGLCCVIINGLK
jgi:hypothetical protein